MIWVTNPYFVVTRSRIRSRSAPVTTSAVASAGSWTGGHRPDPTFL